MTVEEWMKQSAKKAAREAAAEAYKKGQKEGQKEGQESVLQLVDLMIQDGETDQVSRLKTDPVFLKEMMEKYHI